MSQSETPLTDAVNAQVPASYIVMTSHARRMEKDRAVLLAYDIINYGGRLMKMPCSNTVAERMRDRSESRDEAIWHERAPRIAQEKAEEILDHQKIWGVTIEDFLDGREDEFYRLVCMWRREDVLNAHADLRNDLEKEIKDWLINNRQDYIWHEINAEDE